MSARRASRYHRPSPRGALLGALAIVVGSILFGVAVSRSGDDASPPEAAETTTTEPIERLDRVGSEEVDDARPVRIGNEPSAYRITYLVSARGTSPTRETITVQRPFASETVSYADVDGDETTDIQRYAFGRLISDADEEKPLVFGVIPAPSPADYRLAQALDEAVDRGLLERREVREVAGRRCQVYRAGSTLAGGHLQKLGDPSAEHADACFDARGLLLEEWWVLDGHGLRQRVATEVVEDVPADFGAEWSDLATSMDVQRGGGSVLRVRDGTAPPGDFFELADVPAGFERVGRYSVVPPQAENFSEEGDRSAVRASTVDVWERGPDVLLLDQGGTMGGLPVYKRDPANRTIDVPGFGEAEVVVTLIMTELRIHRDVGHYIRIAGTLPADVLAEIARSLVQVERPELVIEEGPLRPE